MAGDVLITYTITEKAGDTISINIESTEKIKLDIKNVYESLWEINLNGESAYVNNFKSIAPVVKQLPLKKKMELFYKFQIATIDSTFHFEANDIKFTFTRCDKKDAVLITCMN